MARVTSTITVLKKSTEQSRMNVVKIEGEYPQDTQTVEWSDKELKLELLKEEMIRDGVDGGYVHELANLAWAVGYDAGHDNGFEAGQASMDTSANVGKG